MSLGYNSKVTSRTHVCHQDSSILGVAHVESYALTKCNTENVYTVKVKGVDDYPLQCDREGHRDCMGHIGLSPRKQMLFPGSMCTVIGDVVDNMYRNGSLLLRDEMDYSEYKASLTNSMLTKHGILRDKCLSGVVSGSLRMVIVPSWELRINEVFIPRYATETLIVPTTVSGGKSTHTYQYASITEGSWVIAVRPPSLTEASVQPMRVRFWDRTAIGFSPFNCTETHADFDGDEIQLYMITEPDSIKECEAWSMATRHQFNLDKIREELGPLYNPSTFMKYTTITLDEALANVPVSPSMAAAKVKKDFFSMIPRQMGQSVQDFILASEQGMHDIMEQQLTQGEVGRISRMARAGCMDFVSFGDRAVRISGDVGCRRGDVVVPSIPLYGARAGFPACVLVSKICAVVQQSYLDSHRAKLERVKRFDMATRFIVGSPETIVISKAPQRCDWQSMLGDKYLCKISGPEQLRLEDVIGTYSSSILSLLPAFRRYEAALAGLTFLVKYHSIATTPIEVNALADVLVCDCDRTSLPPTDGRGVGKRSYRWLTKVVAQHWKKVGHYQGRLDTIYNVDTRVEACMFGNFRHLPSVLTHPKTGGF